MKIWLKQSIRGEGKFRTLWDLFIIILALWTCFSLPVQIAFQPDSLETEANMIFNFFIDIAYIVDILLNFRTTIRHS